LVEESEAEEGHPVDLGLMEDRKREENKNSGEQKRQTREIEEREPERGERDIQQKRER
jgi:hypothetical protein